MDSATCHMLAASWRKGEQPLRKSADIGGPCCEDSAVELLSKRVSPDVYGDDSDNDIGPRLLSTPVRFDATLPLQNSVVLIEAVSLFNKALRQHASSQIFEAAKCYEHLLVPLHGLLLAAGRKPSDVLLSLAMRVYNNLGFTSYADGQDEQALTFFQEALKMSKELSHLGGPTYCLEHATVLSNLCRVKWVQGDICDTYYADVREVLRIRSSLLSWNHPDVAAAHYNLATAAYARRNNAEAQKHLKQYLQVAATMEANGGEDSNSKLDAIPAMVYLLVLQNEKKQDSMSQELVRGLHALQDKRQEDGRDSAEVASILNFVGTLLFHKGDLDDALVFFIEELRLEEMFANGDDDMSVSVTCNNLGRIYQERERYSEAIEYYRRALKPIYGNLNYKMCASLPSKHDELDAASMNLYSTVWYNLGLIHDKNTEYAQAIDCFKMSLDLRRAILGRDHPDVACLHFNIGVLQTEQQQLDDASVSLKEALRARGNGVAASNKLNDQRFVKTLEKLATLQKNKGNITAAVDAWKQALRIMEVSPEIDTFGRVEYVALVLRSIAELHHAAGDLNAALAAAVQSGRKLETLIAAYGSKRLTDETNKLAHIEQLVSSLLLVGSIHHEMSEPIKADAILVQAKVVLDHTARTQRQPLPASLLALREVSSMLVTERCAPQA